MVGDMSLLKESLANRDQRIGRRGTQRREDTSVFTEVVREATQFGEEMREEFKKLAPAPIMKRRLTADQMRYRLNKQSQEENQAMFRKFGRPFVELAAKIQGERDAR